MIFRYLEPSTHFLPICSRLCISSKLASWEHLLNYTLCLQHKLPYVCTGKKSIALLPLLALLSFHWNYRINNSHSLPYLPLPVSPAWGHRGSRTKQQGGQNAIHICSKACTGLFKICTQIFQISISIQIFKTFVSSLEDQFS